MGSCKCRISGLVVQLLFWANKWWWWWWWWWDMWLDRRTDKHTGRHTHRDSHRNTSLFSRSNNPRGLNIEWINDGKRRWAKYVYSNFDAELECRRTRLFTELNWTRQFGSSPSQQCERVKETKQGNCASLSVSNLLHPSLGLPPPIHHLPPKIFSLFHY